MVAMSSRGADPGAGVARPAFTAPREDAGATSFMRASRRRCAAARLSR
jgi:hypothetical protein